MSDSFVVFNVLTVPENHGATLEERFANRAGEVEKMEGFQHFELLRPVEGTDRYLVYTRWDTKAHFDAWVESREFQRGHAGDRAETNGERPIPAATGSELWSFDVVVEADKPVE